MPCYYHYYYNYVSRFMSKYFCKKRVHSNPLSKCGLGLIITNEKLPNYKVNPNVIVSSSSVNPMAVVPSSTKKDPGGIGFTKEEMDIGLMSCTESLGFESCDERKVEEDEDGKEYDKFRGGAMDRWGRKRNEDDRKRSLERNVNRKFPPLISSLNQNGQPCYYLKPVRQNGRLELTEVRIQRPEILRAVREDGRLRLHLVSSDNNNNVFSDEIITEVEEDDDDHKMEDAKQEDDEQEQLELWKCRSVGGEAWRSCNEQVMSHHHHHHNHHSLHVWRQPCVTTR